MSDVRLVVCVNERLGPGKKSCAVSGSRELLPFIRKQLEALNLDFAVTEQVCLGRCMEGIAMRIAPGGPFFTEVTREDIPEIIRQLDQFASRRGQIAPVAQT